MNGTSGSYPKWCCQLGFLAVLVQSVSLADSSIQQSVAANMPDIWTVRELGGVF